MKFKLSSSSLFYGISFIVINASSLTLEALMEENQEASKMGQKVRFKLAPIQFPLKPAQIIAASPIELPVIQAHHDHQPTNPPKWYMSSLFPANFSSAASMTMVSVHQTSWAVSAACQECTPESTVPSTRTFDAIRWPCFLALSEKT